MSLTKVRKLNIADFSQANRDDISKIAAAINPTLDELQSILKKGLTVEKNLPFSYSDVSVIVDSSNNVTNNAYFNSTLNIKGLQVISVKGDLVGSPFVVYEVTNNVVKLTKVFGLQANKEYKLTLFIFG